MGELIIQDKIIISEIEKVLDVIYKASGRRADAGLIKKFICNEKATKFYIDEKLGSSVEEQKDSRYVWLDTGYLDAKERPLMICLYKNGNEYIGNYTGTFRSLADYVKNYNRKTPVTEQNYRRFLDKYNRKIQDRKLKYIGYEDVQAADLEEQDPGDSEMARKIKALNFIFEAVEESSPEDSAEEDLKEEAEELITEEIITRQQNEEEEITIGLLMDKIQGMEAYISELLEIISKNEKQSESVIRELTKKNEEYHETILHIRDFKQQEEEQALAREQQRNEEEGKRGHELLKGNQKILVLGDAGITLEIMQAIAKKEYGFAKNDIEFQVDYKKIVGVSKRVHSSNRYAAMILGKCPHKVANLGSWSSIIAEFEQAGYQGETVAARSESGELKITKGSFRNALEEIYQKLSSQSEN